MAIGASVGTAIGISTMAAATPMFPALYIIQSTLIGAGAGLMPDLDHPNSKLSHDIAPIPILSRRLNFILMSVGVLFLAYSFNMPLISSLVPLALWLLVAALSPHRGVTHSLLGLVSATYALYGWLGTPMSLAFGCAYLSHLIADSFTDGGVPFLWPWLKDFSIKTGLSTGGFFTTIFESIVQICCVLWIGFLVFPYLQQFPGQLLDWGAHKFAWLQKLVAILS